MRSLVQMAAAALRLAGRPGLEGIGRWVHMLASAAHFITKSRGYSTVGDPQRERWVEQGRRTAHAAIPSACEGSCCTATSSCTRPPANPMAR